MIHQDIRLPKEAYIMDAEWYQASMEQYLPEAITKSSARCTASGYVLIQRRYVGGA